MTARAPKPSVPHPRNELLDALATGGNVVPFKSE